jgi:hypothetical protein
MGARGLDQPQPDRCGGSPSWRIQQLVAAGFDPDSAARLATDPRIDLHALLRLTDRGCPPDLAARIEAPLDSTVVRERDT